MDYIQQQFYYATDWNNENSYSRITETTKNLIDFPIPNGVSLNVSSQSSDNSCTSYRLSNLGLVNGSIAYLYSSADLKGVKSSKDITLQQAVAGYKLLNPLRDPSNELFAQRWLAGSRIDSKDTLLYGRIFLPGNSLEAMWIKRLSYFSQLLVTCVSDSKLKNNGALTLTYQRDTGRFNHEFIYSTHEALLGMRSLYNLGESSKSRLSMGTELYYGVLNKAPGLSMALRYTTQSTYTGTPLTMTLMCNPLMGHFSATYALRTTQVSSFASRFDFNVYSYLSDLTIGCEIWRKKKSAPIGDDEYSSVIKASGSVTNQRFRVALETRYKDFLVSTGLGLSKNANRFDSILGIELQYSS